MKKFSTVKLVWAAVALSLCACQHDIDPDDLSFPPEYDESGFVSATTSKEEVEKELREIAKAPYPPYTIQGGDTFRIRVYGEEELNTASNTPTVVTPDGYLIMGLVDPILVKDLTIVQATEKVRDSLKKYVKIPRVSLIPESIQGKSATLMGAVRDPGNYPVNSNIRLSDFVASGRGFAKGVLDNTTADLADLPNSYIIRNDKILPVNFTEAIIKGNQLHNIKIYPNDIIFIATREDSRILVMGEVKMPRALNWINGLTVSDAIAQAGGLMDDYWGTALILRKPRDKEKNGGALEVYKVDVDDLLAGRCRDFKVSAGDIVYIPKDSLGEYNVFIRKLIPTAQLINLLMSPPAYWFGPNN